MTGVHLSSRLAKARIRRSFPAALTEQHRVVPGQDGPLDLGQDGGVVADDAGKPVLAGAHAREQVLAEFLFDRAVAVAGRTQLAQRRRHALRRSYHIRDASSCADIRTARLMARAPHSQGCPCTTRVRILVYE